MLLCFASHNKHKTEEVAAFLGYKIYTLDDIGCHEDIAETADTFHGNSLLKAKYVYDNFHCNCFADDSGLEVDALRGAPGVYSARYSGIHGNHAANNALLLKNMTGENNRQARFKTVITLIWGGTVHVFEGTVEGKILDAPQGEGGFGYDPLFVPDGFEHSFAEMTLAEKNLISHRGRALQKLKAFLDVHV
jgi:XTP/dITP diphosphohydrolase